MKSNLSREQDPTQQGKNRKQATNYLVSKNDRIAISLEDYIRAVERERSPDGESWVYQIPQEDDRYDALFLAALYVGGELFMAKNVEAAFRSGVFGTERDLENDINKFLQQGDTNRIFNFNSVLGSTEYNRTLTAYIESAEDSMKGIAQETSSRISSLVVLAMAAGLSEKEIIDMVNEQMRIMYSKQERVVVTTINQGLNQGKIIATGLAALALGLSGKVRHISALLPTTRAHHASRHGKVYDAQEQNIWWAQGANRINCYCSILPLLKL